MKEISTYLSSKLNESWPFYKMIFGGRELKIFQELFHYFKNTGKKESFQFKFIGSSDKITPIELKNIYICSVDLKYI
jgi:hypothetical protein